MNIPTALLTAAGRVDSYRMDEYAPGLDESYPIWVVLHESMGFGKPAGYLPARVASGKVNDDCEAVVRYIADILGIALDRVDLDWETVTSPRDLQTTVGMIAQDTICAHRWRLTGIVEDQPVVAVQYFATVSSGPWPSAWPKPSSPEGGMICRVRGRPNLRMELYFEPTDGDAINPGITVTAMAAVNAIPAVVEAEAGVIGHPLAGPTS